jgi:C-terminal processing protease CtpA/Prc
MRLFFFLFASLFSVNAYAFEPISTDTLPAGYGKKFSKQELAEDISFMVRSMESAHPDLYHSISKKAYRRLTDSVLSLMRDGMNRDEAWPLFARMIAAIGEGHTTFGNTLEIRQEVGVEKRPVFPVDMQPINGEFLLVKEDWSDQKVLQAGDHIVTINGKNMDSLVSAFTRYYGGLPAWQLIRVIENLPLDLYRHQIKAPFHVVFIRGNQEMQATLPGLPYVTIKTKAAQSKNNRQAFTFERLPNQIGYLNFRDMDRHLYPSFDSFLLKTFTSIKEQPLRALIIDVRENGGGDSRLGNRLLQYITDKPYRMAGGVIFKVSQEYKNEIGKRDSAAQADFAFYTAKENGSFIKGGNSKPVPPPNNDLAFKGKVGFLMGPNTFSSANMLVATIKDYRLATIIGENSGEPGNDYGEMLSLKLPHTGILFNTSSKQFIRPNGDKKDKNPILPDIYVKQDPSSKDDTLLKFALEWAAK